MATTDYSTKTRNELIAICKEKGIKGYSGKKHADILALLKEKSQSKQDTGKFRTNIKDQFYTNENVAKSCIQRILTLLPHSSDYLWIEPSAGNGAFLHNIPAAFAKVGIDLDPKAADIQKHDYLEWTLSPTPTDKNIIVFGNPPFGRQSSLAKAFIAKSCEFAQVIAFILPKSFTKPSMTNTFGRRFHCLQSVDLEKNSFVINGAPYDVPCVFQIWEKKDTDRTIEAKIAPVGFQYVKSTDTISPYHIAFRRVGGLAGKCYKNDGTAYSVQSHHFLRFAEVAVSHTDAIIEQINAHVFPSNTVGPRSLSKSEVNVVLNSIIQTLASSSSS